MDAKHWMLFCGPMNWLCLWLFNFGLFFLSIYQNQCTIKIYGQRIFSNTQSIIVYLYCYKFYWVRQAPKMSILNQSVCMCVTYVLVEAPCMLGYGSKMPTKRKTTIRWDHLISKQDKNSTQTNTTFNKFHQWMEVRL